MKNIVYYIAIATVLLFASCASELDTEPSGSQVSDEQLSELISLPWFQLSHHRTHKNIPKISRRTVPWLNPDSN